MRRFWGVWGEDNFGLVDELLAPTTSTTAPGRPTSRKARKGSKPL